MSIQTHLQQPTKWTTAADYLAKYGPKTGKFIYNYWTGSRRTRRNMMSKVPPPVNAWNNCARINTLERRVKNLRPERKYIIETDSAQAIDNAAGTLWSLNECAQGDTTSTRTGGTIRMSDVTIRMHLKQHDSATHTTVRVILGYTADDTQPSVSTVLQSANPLAHRCKESTMRFRVLYDNLICLDISYLNTPVLKVYRKIGRIAKYTSSSATSWKVGRLWLFAIADEATNQPTMDFHSCVNYTDV